MADEVLDAVADAEALSFYGLVHWLSELDKLLERADHAAVVKAPRQEDVAIAERKEEILEAQARLRRAMGAQLAEEPSLTAQERPMGEAFLKEQLAKLEAQGARDARAAQGAERLQTMLNRLLASPAAMASKEVRRLEALIKSQSAEWKELSPVFDKWQAGRYNFKSNEELQTFRRRYEECKRGRDTNSNMLHKALCARRDEQTAEPTPSSGPGKGWAAVARQAPPPPPPKAKAANRWARPAAPAPKAARSPPAWGSSVASFAQRLRADIVAQVRREAEGGEDDAEEGGDDEDDDDERPPPPPPKAAPKAAPKQAAGQRPPPPPPPLPVVPKGPPPLPAAWAKPRGPAAAQAAEESAEEEEAEEPRGAAAPASAAKEKAKAKAKGGKKKKKEKGGKHNGDDDYEGLPHEPARASRELKSSSARAWASSTEAMFSGSLLQELLQRESWDLPGGESQAAGRLADLTDRLHWSSPLGLQLPMAWDDFAALEVDGGPKRTSKRGTPPWVTRVQKTVPMLLAHYVTVLFVVTLLHSLTGFGLLVWAFAAQAALILAPTELPQLPTPARVLLLQAAHVLLWIMFVRSVWMTHLFVKLLAALSVVGHAYVVQDARES